MRFKSIRNFVPLLWCASLGVSAQTAGSAAAVRLPEPLVLAVKKAVSTNPEVLAKWNGFLAAESQRDVARSGFLPQLDVSASIGVENRATSNVTNNGTSFSSLKLTANQILFDGGFTAQEVKRLGAAQRVRYYELAETAEAVALDTVKAYADVARFRELVDLATQNYAEHKAAALRIEERVNSGVGRRVDLEQANGRLALAESNLLTELTNLHDVSNRYLRVVGEQPAMALPSLPEPFRLGQLPADTEALMQDGMRKNPTLRAAALNALASDVAVQTARASNLPRVDLQGYASAGSNANGVSGDSRAAGAAVALSYNLFKGGADRANEKRASLNALQARDLQDKACRDVRQTLSLAFSDVRSLSEKLAYEDRHRLSIEKTREAYRQQFDIGQRTLMDLLDTQNEFFQAARSYTQVRHDQAIAQARTLAAMGQLVTGFGATNPMLDSRADEEEAGVAALCAGDETVVDTVDRIKAGLQFGRPEKGTGSYVVLLPDRDNGVGKVVVQGKAGTQVLQDAQKGVKTNGGGGTFAVSNEQLKRDFGGAMAALPVAPERFVLYFQRGSDVLLPESKALIPRIVERAAAHPGLDMSVIGHTDTSGSDQINEVLGRERAAFVLGQLREAGLKTDTVVEESFGKKSLEVPTPDNTKEPRNRRVEVILR